MDVTELDMLGHELWDSPFVSQRIPAHIEDMCVCISLGLGTIQFERYSAITHFCRCSDLFQNPENDKLDSLPMCDDWPGFRDVPDNFNNVV